jgi:hypothetical protein
MHELRRPGAVSGIDVTGGLDTDGDGRADTVVTSDGADLVLHTDLDGDDLADRMVHIGPDGTVWEEVIGLVDRLLGDEPAG